MIGQLTGNVTYKDNRFLILTVNGVGYKIYATREILEQLTPNSEPINLWTHLVVKEDALDLYGFLTQIELKFFELLISISGVGPRSALSILSLAPPETLRKAIVSGKTEYLTQVSGIGRKIAEKIILELRDKLEHTEENNEELDKEAEAIMAMESLGYSSREAREALRQVSPEIKDTSEKVKQALKQLHQKK